MPLTAPFSFDSHAETDGRVLSSFHRQLDFFRKSAKTEIFEKRGAPPENKKKYYFFRVCSVKREGAKDGADRLKGESRKQKAEMKPASCVHIGESNGN